MKKIITIDCDNVLSATSEAMLAHYNYTLSGRKVTKDDITHHRYHCVPSFTLTKEEAMRLWHDFFIQSSISDLEPEPGAVKAIYSLHDAGYEMYIVTGRKSERKEQTYAWVHMHFPGIFKDIVFANDLTDNFVSKGELCSGLDAILHIDDHIDYAVSTAEQSISTLLYTQPWNKNFVAEQPEIVRVADREIILDYIQKYV